MNRADKITDLMYGCKANDPKAQRELYNLLSRKMAAYISRYVNSKEDAEEIVNTGFCRAFRKIHLYSGIGDFEGWISVIIKRAAIDHLKRKLKARESMNVVELKEYENFKHPEIGDSVDYIYKSMEGLPKKTKRVMDLFIRGFKHSEIGDIIGISEGTSKWHVHEAKKIMLGRITKKAG
jgi:RNA polymerase sigma-70 factor (ECF subfamily)